MTSTIPHTRTAMSDAVDLLTHIADGPMSEHVNTHTERIALLTLDSIAYRGDDAPTMSELGRRIGLSRAAITTLVDRLTDLGYVVRTPDAEDRRRMRVVLTAAGRELVADALAFTPDILAN